MDSAALATKDTFNQVTDFYRAKVLQGTTAAQRTLDRGENEVVYSVPPPKGYGVMRYGGTRSVTVALYVAREAQQTITIQVIGEEGKPTEISLLRARQIGEQPTIKFIPQSGSPAKPSASKP